MDRARAEFHRLLAGSSRGDLARASHGTRWTNEQLLFHMLFGYLIVRNLRVIVKVFARLPEPVGRAFARLLDSLTRPFHVINFWGSQVGARVIRPARMGRRFDKTIASLQRHLDVESEPELDRRMRFPTRWDPFFTDTMTLREVYHYATQHFDFHRAQLTLDLAD
ncbi:MAG: DinB family protein [Actinobacteria bacterium]|nr:DinB family protein [Actinomycetota bacterium]